MSVLETCLGLETRREAIAPRVDADAPLLEALRRQDPSAAERLVGTFGDRAYRLALGISGTRRMRKRSYKTPSAK